MVYVAVVEDSTGLAVRQYGPMPDWKAEKVENRLLKIDLDKFFVVTSMRKQPETKGEQNGIQIT